MREAAVRSPSHGCRHAEQLMPNSSETAAGMPAAREATRNLLLDAVCDNEWARLSVELVRVTLSAGQVLRRPGVAMRDAYFPTTAVVSKLYLMEDGSSPCVALVGHEGVVGVSLVLGTGDSPIQSQVLQAGYGWRLPARSLQREFERRGALAKALLEYTQSFIAQMMQTAACNNRSTLQQRLCRWLLMNLDRTAGDEIQLTHQAIADVLGVRRESISETAGVLQDQGAIRYRWGRISVLDRAALERHAREFYSPIRTSSTATAYRRTPAPTRHRGARLPDARAGFPSVGTSRPPALIWHWLMGSPG